MSHCREIKYYLKGGYDTFDCDLVELQEGHGILKYVIPKPYQVAELNLLPGDLTYAFYWEKRPYTLYKWIRESHYLGNYFNIADSIKLDRKTFVWRDLIVDIWIPPEGILKILDWHELPNNLSPSLKRYIAQAQQEIRDNYLQVIHETDQRLHELGIDII